jgi:hypothetical protein
MGESGGPRALSLEAVLVLRSLWLASTAKKYADPQPLEQLKLGRG